MYDLINELIDEGEYDLIDLLLKIDHAWLRNQITAGQRDELEDKAREYAMPEGSYASDKQRILNLEIALRALEDRVTILESAGGGSGGNTPVDEWPEWVQPSGALDAYGIGDKVTFENKHYISLISSNVWSPLAYPQGWEEVE